MNEGKLWLLYSSEGKVESLEIPILKKKPTNQLIIDQANYQLTDFDGYNLQTVEPEILINEVLPTFSKISTILEFVNINKNVENLRKKSDKRIAQPINILKYCHKKLRKVVPLRYCEHPQNLYIPFLKYFHNLTFVATPPICPSNIFFNNARTDLATIMTYHGKLSFNDSKRAEPIIFEK